MEGTRIAKILVLVLFICSSTADNKTYSSTTEDLQTTSNEVTEVPTTSTSIETNKNISEATTKGDNTVPDAPNKADSTTTITPNEAENSTSSKDPKSTSTEDPQPTSTEDPQPTSTEEPKPTTVTPPPSNFDGLSFLGGILLAVGAMILLFIAYKYFGPGRGDKGSYNRIAMNDLSGESVQLRV